jgi:hypothetical protein
VEKTNYIMKELKFAFFIAAILLFSSSFALAAPANLYWHSYDYYDIELSGSGNAFVVGTVQLEALTPQSVSTISLEIPYRSITVYKLIQDGGYYRPPCFNIPCQNGPCAPCSEQYLSAAFLNYSTQALSDSTILTINLAYPVQNDTTVTLYLIFSTKSIAVKTFQGFSFNFKTVQDPNALIRSLSANVVVPQNMYLKGKPKFDIQYTPSELAAESLKGSAESVAGVMRSYPVYGGQFTANNLQPGESFTISGLYGDNQMLLYLQEIVFSAAGLIVLAVLVKFFFADRLGKMFSKREVEERSSRRQSEFSFGRPILVGFISSLIFIGVYYLLNIIFGNGYYYNSPIGTITLLVLNAVFVILSIFGLPYYLYSKFSKTEGFLAGIISLVLSFVLLILLLPQYSPPILLQAISGTSQIMSGATSVK